MSHAVTVDRRTLWRRVLGVSLAAVALFTLVSALTFVPDDLPAWTTSPNQPLDNWCGIVGARLAGTLFIWLGLTTFLAVLLIGVLGIFHLIGKRIEDFWMRLGGGLLLVTALSVLLNMSAFHRAYMPGSGGTIGLFLGDHLMKYFGAFGSWLVTIFALFIALLLLSIEEAVGRGLRMAGAGLKSVWTQIPRHRPKRRRSVLGSRAADATVPVAEIEGPLAVATLSAPTRAQPAAAPVEDDIPPPPIAPLEPKETESRPTELPPSEFGDPTAEYSIPPIDLLEVEPAHKPGGNEEMIETNAAILQSRLGEFGIGAEVVNIEQGPVVTRFELDLAAGTKVTKITTLSDDIAIALKAPTIRVVAPIPGKSTVGVEVPNPVKDLVRLRSLLVSEAYRPGSYKIPIFLGRGASGAPAIEDLTRMPHLLIAGATGSGKSVCINAVLLSILMTSSPEDVRLILIDPKMVELVAFERIPHLLTPVVTDMKRAPLILDWATRLMDERYDLFSRVGVRHISQFNALGADGVRSRLSGDFDPERTPLHMHYMIIIIDELADLMFTAAKEVEASITRLAQKSRGVGIHIVMATQRPSVDVITGLIKSNLPARVSFRVTSKVDSRTILDRNGAEKLLGCGDMLFLRPGTSDIIRIQGTYVTESEIQKVVKTIQTTAPPREPIDLVALEEDPVDPAANFHDELYADAVRIVLETQRGSVSLLQRRLEIGYTRAARLIDMMAAAGLVGSHKGMKAREVVLTLEQWEQCQGRAISAEMEDGPNPPDDGF